MLFSKPHPNQNNDYFDCGHMYTKSQQNDMKSYCAFSLDIEGTIRAYSMARRARQSK